MGPIMTCLSALTTRIWPAEAVQGQNAIFDDLAATWWDESGPHRLLHRMNPVRLSYVGDYVDVAGLSLLDIGCGGGIVCEPFARQGARVTGIDTSAPSIEIARSHGVSSGLSIAYHHATITEYAENHPEQHDVVTAFEVIEHTANPAAFLAGCAATLKPGGFLFLSTINRTWLAGGIAILGAEYIARIVPRGTHRFQDFVTPAEIAQQGRLCGLKSHSIQGITYHPLQKTWVRIDRPDVNYMMCLQKEGA